MKQKILIKVDDSENWIGGLYYKRNVIFSFLQNSEICNKYKIVLCIREKDIDLFKCFEDKIDIMEVKGKSRIGKALWLIKSSMRGVKYIFPMNSNKLCKLLRLTCIAWIADLQHDVYPEYFSNEERKVRHTHYQAIQNNNQPLVLSSNSSKQDFIRFYGEKTNIYIFHFVSYIEPELNQLADIDESALLKKYNLEKYNYICISNQFWKHKNHIVVLKAIKLLIEQEKDWNVLFVFTGLPKDYRSPDYYASLMHLLNDPKMQKAVNMLGFIDRIDQIAIMKNAKFIIQPSLFEGWGTVVEDAKVLDKLILLSDIPVHREQMNKNCVLFDPHNPKDLADKILKLFQYNHTESIQDGICDMYKRAKDYSEEFQRLLVK